MFHKIKTKKFRVRKSPQNSNIVIIIRNLKAFIIKETIIKTIYIFWDFKNIFFEDFLKNLFRTKKFVEFLLAIMGIDFLKINNI